MSLSLSEYKTAINTKDDVGSLVCSLYVEYYICRKKHGSGEKCCHFKLFPLAEK